MPLTNKQVVCTVAARLQDNSRQAFEQARMLALQLTASSTRSRMCYSQVDAAHSIARRHAATAAAVVP